MDNFVDERDYKLLENDKYTFFMLGRIMGGKCELLLTDHEKLIICFTCHPYPVWIWTPDEASEEDMERLNQETGIDQKDREDYRPEAETFINTGNMYFWKDEHGNSVACCKFAPNGNMASISLVYTRPVFRRKHYAENLVYQVTKLAMDAGYIPMLYTDADYTAWNACYEKLGYVLRGKLCTIG